MHNGCCCQLSVYVNNVLLEDNITIIHRSCQTGHWPVKPPQTNFKYLQKWFSFFKQFAALLRSFLNFPKSIKYFKFSTLTIELDRAIQQKYFEKFKLPNNKEPNLIHFVWWNFYRVHQSYNVHYHCLHPHSSPLTPSWHFRSWTAIWAQSASF